MRAGRLALLVSACGFHPAAGGDGGPRDAAGDAAGPRDGELDGAHPLDASRDAPPPPPIAFRQLHHTEAPNLATVDVAMQGQLAGDLNVVWIGWFKLGAIASVADSAGNTYAVALGPTASGSENQAVYYACGIVASAANTITVRFAGGNQDPDVRVVEYSGIRASACFDAGRASTGVGTAIDSGTVTTAAANELLVAGDFVTNQTTTGDPAFTSRVITSFGDLVEDRVVVAAGSQRALATENVAGPWVMQLVAFFGQ